MPLFLKKIKDLMARCLLEETSRQSQPTIRGGIMFLLSWAMHLAESSQMPKVEVLPMVQRKNL